MRFAYTCTFRQAQGDTRTHIRSKRKIPSYVHSVTKKGLSTRCICFLCIMYDDEMKKSLSIVTLISMKLQQSMKLSCYSLNPYFQYICTDITFDYYPNEIDK